MWIITKSADNSMFWVSVEGAQLPLFEYKNIWDAAAQVNYLNGGFDLDRLREIIEAATNRIVSRSTTY